MPITLARSEPTRLDWHAHASRAAATQGVGPSASACDASFLALQSAYRAAGGLVRGDDLAVRLGLAGRGGYVDLARRIVVGELFSFHWHDSFWLPMFQFDPLALTLREAPRRVLDELRGGFDGWDLAHWHVQANEALGGQRPLDLLDTDLPAVLTAARACVRQRTDRCVRFGPR
jgi:hypothetical protein